jgi:hypothetical protein
MKFKETHLPITSSADTRRERINQILTPIQSSLSEKMNAAFSSDEERKAAQIAITVCLEAFREFMEFRMKHGENY